MEDWFFFPIWEKIKLLVLELKLNTGDLKDGIIIGSCFLIFLKT
jgi:hypothetical protein